jgi:hypothetical protein
VAETTVPLAKPAASSNATQAAVSPNEPAATPPASSARETAVLDVPDVPHPGTSASQRELINWRIQQRATDFTNAELTTLEPNQLRRLLDGWRERSNQSVPRDTLIVMMGLQHLDFFASLFKNAPASGLAKDRWESNLSEGIRFLSALPPFFYRDLLGSTDPNESGFVLSAARYLLDHAPEKLMSYLRALPAAPSSVFLHAQAILDELTPLQCVELMLSNSHGKPRSGEDVFAILTDEPRAKATLNALTQAQWEIFRKTYEDDPTLQKVLRSLLESDVKQSSEDPKTVHLNDRAAAEITKISPRPGVLSRLWAKLST